MSRRLLIFALLAWVFPAQAQGSDRDLVPARETVSEATLSATVTGAGGVLQHAASPQLLSNEVAVLLEHLQSQHVYLKHLENVRRALEKELSIVRLMRECDGFGSTCTGRGIVDRPSVPESPPSAPEPPPVAPEPPPVAPEPPPAFEEPPSFVPPPKAAYELPVVVGIYRGTASLIYASRRVEVRRGARVGPFVVTAVALDGVRLDGPRGEVSLPLQWASPLRQVPLAGSGQF